MRVTSNFLRRFHLDPRHGLLTGRNVQVIREFFDAMDVRNMEALDDIQFLSFMKMTTDLSENQIYNVFDMFDVDDSGSIEFDEFYLLFCMLVAIKDNEEKQFLFRHSRTCFELLDDDGSEAISLREFERFGFLFNFGQSSIKSIFKEFDVSGDKELDYNEFRMFTFACIDRERELEEEKQRKKEQEMEIQERTEQLRGLSLPLVSKCPLT
eukprot:TRINITY_DN1338_c0_g1_i7.p1 TRINITY_DN1338_c0_g1~~TRINITY_DN1338_c0_g1_i7.p1  ORF type:complete len:210 (-),score=58.16 TRINITY_DN1338_c0_g1_i7:386-1015(-)